MSDRPQLGDVARDRITGFQGVIVHHATWLTGCDTYGLAPQTLDGGKPLETQSFDESRIEVLERGKFVLGNMAPLPPEPAATGPAPARPGGPSSLDRQSLSGRR